MTVNGATGLVIDAIPKNLISKFEPPLELFLVYPVILLYPIVGDIVLFLG